MFYQVFSKFGFAMLFRQTQEINEQSFCCHCGYQPPGCEDDVFIPVVGSFQTEFWNCIIRDKYIQIVFAFKEARPEGSRKTLYFHNKIRETLYQFVAGEELEQASEQYSVIVPIWHNVILDDDNFLEGIFDAFE